MAGGQGVGIENQETNRVEGELTAELMRTLGKGLPGELSDDDMRKVRDLTEVLADLGHMSAYARIGLRLIGQVATKRVGPILPE